MVILPYDSDLVKNENADPKKAKYRRHYKSKILKPIKADDE